MKFGLAVGTVRFVASSVSLAAEDLAVLSALPGEPAPGAMLEVSLKRQAYAAIDRRCAAFETLKSQAELNKDLASATESRNQAVNVVHGALRHYDLPDLIEMAGASKVKVVEPANPLGVSPRF